MSIQTTNPYTGQVVKSFRPLNDDELEHKISDAHKAYDSWKTTPIAERAKYLHKVSELMLERKHELAMQDKAMEFEKLRGSTRMAEIGAYSQGAWNTGALEVLKESITVQAKATGVRWVDALSASVRPIITYWFMSLYCSVKITGFIAAIKGGVVWLVAIPMMWGPDDMAVWAGWLNFWFVGRVFEKTSKV